MYPSGGNTNIFKCVLRERERERVCVCVTESYPLFQGWGNREASLGFSPVLRMTWASEKAWRSLQPLVHGLLALCLPYPQPVTRRPAHPQPWCGPLQPPPTGPILISLQRSPWDKVSFSCGYNLLRSPGASLPGQTELTHRGFPSLSRPFWFKAACQMLRLW